MHEMVKELCQSAADAATLRPITISKLARRHPASERFHAILRELGALHDRKQADYGRENDPFANVRGSEDFGVKPWVGALVRANDKIRRLQKLARGGLLTNETAIDSFDDLAVYAVIGRVLYEQEQDERDEVPF